MKRNLKINTKASLIIFITLALAVIAIITSIQLYRLRKEAISPTSPEESEAATTPDAYGYIYLDPEDNAYWEGNRCLDPDDPNQTGILPGPDTKIRLENHDLIQVTNYIYPSSDGYWSYSGIEGGNWYAKMMHWSEEFEVTCPGVVDGKAYLGQFTAGRVGELNFYVRYKATPKYPQCGDGCIAGLNFDGINDFAEIPHSESVNFNHNTPFSAFAWIYPERTSGNNFIIAKEDGSNTAQTGWHFVYGGTLKLVLRNSDLTQNLISVETQTSTDINSWKYVGFTYDGSGNANGIKIYVDGEPQPLTISYNSLTSSIQSSVNLMIGGWKFATYGGGFYSFQGFIDEVNLWSKSLNQEEVQNNMTSGVAANTPGLAGYWAFNEGQGQTINDATLLKNNGFLGTTISVDVNDPSWTGEGYQDYGDSYCSQIDLNNPNKYACDELRNICVLTECLGQSCECELPTPPPSAQCLDIRIYNDSWNLIPATELGNLKPGEIIFATVRGTTTFGEIDMARFTINGFETGPITDQLGGTEEFYYQYTIPLDSEDLEVSAQLHHTIIDWF